MIQIIAHRGLWSSPSEKNTLKAFRDALDNGFGIETDFRDLNGELVVCHDIPNNQNAVKAKDFEDLLNSYSISCNLALNIKSDGLCHLIQAFINEIRGNDCFVFDMSIPDMRSYLQHGLSVFTRISEYEMEPIFLKDSHGIWVDSFSSEWYEAKNLVKYIEMGKKVAIVSPELHGRPHLKLWADIKNSKLSRSPSLSICTDHPISAHNFFYG